MPKWTVKLACGCLLSWHHTEGDAPCHRRHGYQKIVGFYSREWRARCVNDRCRFNQWCGQSKLSAEQSGRRHERSRRGHRVAVKYDTVGAPTSVAMLRLMVYPVQEQLVFTDESSWPQWVRELPDDPPF